MFWSSWAIFPETSVTTKRLFDPNWTINKRDDVKRRLPPNSFWSHVRDAQTEVHNVNKATCFCFGFSFLELSSESICQMGHLAKWLHRSIITSWWLSLWVEPYVTFAPLGLSSHQYLTLRAWLSLQSVFSHKPKGALGRIGLEAAVMSCQASQNYNKFKPAIRGRLLDIQGQWWAS